MPHDLLSRLRTETRSQHERLESRLALPTRLNNPEEYVDLLLRFRGIYTPLEIRLTALAAAGDLPLSWEPRRKLPLLDADLQAMRLTSEARDASPIATKMPLPETTAEALGCLYVLEGSTLGGQFILREIIGGQAALEPITAVGATRFFGSYGSEVGKRWREFCVCLNDWGAEANDEERTSCTTFAGLTFTGFDHWLTGGDEA